MLIWILSGSLAAGHVTQTRTVLILITRYAHRHRNRAYRGIWLQANPLFYSPGNFESPFELATVGPQRQFVRWCKRDVHTNVPRPVPLAPPSLCTLSSASESRTHSMSELRFRVSDSFHVRAPLPSLGVVPLFGSRASESRVTPIPVADGPSHLRVSISPVGPLPAGLRRRRR